MKKNILATALLVLTFSISNLHIIFANEDILYSQEKVETITSGLTFKHMESLYKSGWKDIYVLTADLTNPNIDFEIIKSKTEHGLKKSVKDLVIENNALAGINADFFSGGNPTSSMGYIINDGKVEETKNYYNSSINKYAGIFEDKYGNAFIDYIKTQLTLYNDKGSVVEVEAKNKITTFAKPVYFNRDVITNTNDLDKRNHNLFKIVVEDNIITKKASKSENVEIPENGFILVMNENCASKNLAKFVVGEKIYFKETYKFAFRNAKKIEEIIAGTSAGGEILRNGKQIDTGLIIEKNERHPRSAVGVNKEKNKIIIVAVDGRGASIGANQNEMAQIMLENGAYDAIHLDGGGSTTLALKEEGKSNIEIVNKTSNGVRKVPNAIAIKSNNEIGEVKKIKIKIDNDILAKQTYNVKVYGLDENENTVKLDENLLTLSFENAEDGVINGNNFLLNNAGDYKINAVYNANSDNQIKESVDIKVLKPLTHIIPSITNANIDLGEEETITAKIINEDGFYKNVPTKDISITSSNNETAKVYGDKIVGMGEGSAIISLTYKDINASINVVVGSKLNPITSFETYRDLFMMYYPKENGTNKSLINGAGITNETYTAGSNSLVINYEFKENMKTPQATYVCFEKEPIIIKEKVNSINFDVKSDGSSNLLKAVLKDANKKEYIITISENLKGKGWGVISANVPKDMVYPITLDKIYVATLNTTQKEKSSINIDNINTTSKATGGGEITTTYKDELETNILTEPKKSNEQDICIFGQTSKKDYENSTKALQDSITSMSGFADTLAFVGETNLDGVKIDVPFTLWQNKYATTSVNNISIISLATKSGNMRKESENQWRWLQSYLENQSKNNIIITMDKNIWNKEYNLVGRENELLHKILKEFVEKAGKNILVVSATNDITNVNIVDGVRYINLSGLTLINKNAKDFKYLRVRANEDSLKYEIIDVYAEPKAQQEQKVEQTEEIDQFTK